MGNKDFLQSSQAKLPLLYASALLLMAAPEKRRKKEPGENVSAKVCCGG